MIGIGIIFITLALVLYTTAVWVERVTKKLKLWIVYTFWSGFVCDLIGTSMMMLLYFTKEKLSFNHVHTILGYVVLLIMLLHLIWAILSFKSEKYEVYFTRFSIVAWTVWIFAFVSGLILKYYGL